MGTWTFLEFFAGGGLARIGLGERWTCLLANDWDKKKAATYKDNWPDDAFVDGDVGDIKSAQIRGKADLVWASFPCQDVSLAGAGAGLKGKRSGTFWPFWNLIKSLKQENRSPRLIVLENVCGMISSGKGRDFDAICNAVVDAGYSVGAVVIDACLFLPHSRPRLFLIAVNDIIKIPEQLTSAGPRYFHSDALKRFVAETMTIDPNRWIWWNPNPPASDPITLTSIIGIDPNKAVWDDYSKTCDLLKMMSPATLKKMAHIRRSKTPTIGTIYKRMRINRSGKKVQRAEARFDGMAGCLRAPTGGSSRQQILYVNGNNIKSRLLTGDEALQLMGVPKNYSAPINYNEKYKIAGEGVAVPVVEYLSKFIIEPILEFNKI